MTLSLEQRVADLENEISRLSHVEKELIGKLKNVELSHGNLVKASYRLHQDHAEEISKLRDQNHKYDEAYYKVFPERLGPDLKLLNQLAEIKAKAGNQKS